MEVHLSRDHMMKRSHGLEAGVLSMQVTTLSSLVVIDVAKVQISGLTFFTRPLDQKVT